MIDMTKLNPIIYRFSNREVQEGDLSRFLSLFDAKRFQPGEHLQTLLGSLHLVIGDYTEHVGVEDFEIPEVREFTRRLRNAFPYMSYFCSLESPLYSLIAYSSIDNLEVVRSVKGAGHISITCPYDMMDQFVTQEIAAFREFAQIAKLTKLSTDERIAALRRYFFTPKRR